MYRYTKSILHLQTPASIKLQVSTLPFVHGETVIVYVEIDFLLSLEVS